MVVDLGFAKGVAKTLQSNTPKRKRVLSSPPNEL
jgi:hypothetical protein